MKKILLRVFIVLFLLYCIVMMLLTSFLYETSFKARTTVTSEESESIFSAHTKLSRKRFEIQSKDGITLVGYLYTSISSLTPKGLIILSHGIGSDHLKYINEIEYFALQGYNVFGFDNTGSGESSGTSVIGLSRSVIDLDAVLRYIEENSYEFDNLPIFLYGHSWGGFAVCAVNNYNHRISGIVERSGFNKPSSVIYEKIVTLSSKRTANMLLPFVHIYEFIKFGKYSVKTAIDGLNVNDCPALTMHSYDDTIVSFGSSIVGNKDKIKNIHVKSKEFYGKGHSITSIFKDKKIVGIDYEVLDLIVEFYNDNNKR